MKAAAWDDPLLRDFHPTLVDAEREWSMVSRLSGARAQALVDDFPVAAAMVRARLLATLGSEGLQFRSLYQSDDQPDTDQDEEQTRRDIERVIRSASRWIDAGARLSRRQVEKQIRQTAIIRGDGFAIRVLQDDRPQSPIEHAWRQIPPERICNPPTGGSMWASIGCVTIPGRGVNAGRKIVDGIEFDSKGRRVALHYLLESVTAAGIYIPGGKTVRIPWYAPDGTPNVLHATGMLRPGAARGITEFAPIILDGRLLQSLGIAYVASKRVHASHPMLLKVDDIAAARKAYTGTAFANLLIGRDHDVTMNQVQFAGADYREFFDVGLRSLTSVWGMPYELVLGDHSAKSGASSRSLWQQFYMNADEWQSEHVDEVTGVIDSAIIREAVARRMLSLSDNWQRNMLGRYKRPPRIMPDPLKEAQAGAAWVALGVSKTSIFADAGWDHGDETMQRHQDRMLEDAQGSDEPGEPEAPDQQGEPEEQPQEQEQPEEEPANV